MKSVHHAHDPDPRSILVILPTWVGDFVMATPFLRALRNRFSVAHIKFLIEPNLRDLAAGGDWANEWVEWPRSRGPLQGGLAAPARSPIYKAYRDLVWDLRRRRYDWAVLLPNSFRSALIARLAGAKRRIGYDRDGRGWLLTDRISPPNRSDGVFQPMPLVNYYADLAQAVGCERPADRLELFTTPECEESLQRRLASLEMTDHHPLVVVSPGAKYGAAKCWFPDRFAAVADRLIEEDGATVVITCGPGEEPIARQIASNMKCQGIVFDEPRLSLGELKSLIRRSDLLICNDTGPRHFAKAFDVGVVTVFGPTDPEWTATSHEQERIVRIDVECGPCQKRDCPLEHLDCMTGVTVDMVVNASRELLTAALNQNVKTHQPR